MATSSDPNSSLPDWTDLYSHNKASAAAAAAGINISSMTSMSMPDLTANSGSGSPPGRIGKSPRRRSRASRRAPVTLLNTDTSNFRAMVQQFTGIPSSSSSSSGAYTSGISGSGGPTISFSAPNMNTMRPSGGGVMSFGGGGQPQQYQYQYQSRQPPFQEQIYHSRQQQQQQYDEYGAGENNNNNNMFINGARAGAGAGAGGGGGGGGYHDMHVNNEGIFDTNHAAHSATNIHLRAHDHPYFG